MKFSSLFISFISFEGLKIPKVLAYLFIESFEGLDDCVKLISLISDQPLIFFKCIFALKPFNNNPDVRILSTFLLLSNKTFEISKLILGEIIG